MARSAVLSNGRLAVCLDEKGLVNDLYYPHVGLRNMLGARFIHHKIGVTIDGVFSWVDSEAWVSEAKLDDDSMIARVKFSNAASGIELSFRDFVDTEFDLFGRVLIVNNRSNVEKNIKIFFCQVYQISDSGRADTALYTPALHPYILTYHGNISFITSLRTEDGAAFDQFAIGNYGIEGKSGTYIDAEDGKLSGNLVEHGGVDSVIACSMTIKSKHSYHVDYWSVASDESYHQASKIHRAVSNTGLFHFLNSTTNYWKNWLNTASGFLEKVDPKYQKLAKVSLLTIKAHCDRYGGVIASLDSSIYNYGRDYYSYVWPRDAYYALKPLVAIGFKEESKSFLDFIAQVITKRGYVQHKYQPDYSPGSTWHPLMQNGKPELNIQSDETASAVLLALDFIKYNPSMKSYNQKLWQRIILPGCNFLASFIDPETKLPRPSYDLWEQVFVTSTYTASITYAALNNAAKLDVDSVSDVEDRDRWHNVAEDIKKHLPTLFDDTCQHFVRGLPAQKSYPDITLDISSVFGPIYFDAISADSEYAKKSIIAAESNLVIRNGTGGVIRYRGDSYMSSTHGSSNPWSVCTLWLGQVQALSGNTNRLQESIDWVLDRSLAIGMLSEQIDPKTGVQRGVSPLVWSHAEFLSSLLLMYRLKEFKNL